MIPTKSWFTVGVSPTGNGPGNYRLFYYKPVSALYGASGVDVNRDGYAELLVSRFIDGGLTEVYRLDSVFTSVPDAEPAPVEFVLYQNYPNPFNPSSVIKYEVPGQVFVQLTVFDILGKEVMTLVNEEQQPGSYAIEWIPERQKGGEMLASGVYLYRLRAGSLTYVKKMLYLK